MKDQIMERIGAEYEQDCWHYPEYTDGCWGSPTYSKCWICKVRYPIKLLALFRRIERTPVEQKDSDGCAHMHIPYTYYDRPDPDPNNPIQVYKCTECGDEREQPLMGREHVATDTTDRDVWDDLDD